MNWENIIQYPRLLARELLRMELDVGNSKGKVDELYKAVDPRLNELRMGDAGSLFTYGGGVLDGVFLTRNAYYDPVATAWKRRVADNNAAILNLTNAGALGFFTQSDANNTVDSTITLASRLSVDATGISTVITDGWMPDFDTWVYVSATSFKIAGKDVRSRFPPGTKIKLTQTTAKYFYVVSTAFSTDTTVTVAAGSDYSVANAAITNPFYSYQAEAQGFPDWFAFAPAWTNITVGSGTNVGKFRMVGRSVEVDSTFTFGTGSAVGSIPHYTAPVPSADKGTFTVRLADSGVANYFGTAECGADKEIYVYKLNVAGTTITFSGVTATTPFTWAASDYINIHGVYGV